MVAGQCSGEWGGNDDHVRRQLVHHLFVVHEDGPDRKALPPFARLPGIDVGAAHQLAVALGFDCFGVVVSHAAEADYGDSIGFHRVVDLVDGRFRSVTTAIIRHP